MAESNVSKLSEEYIAGVLDFVWLPAPGLHTYPGRNEGNDRIHAACETLEARGHLIRKIDEPGHALFMPIDDRSRTIKKG